MIANKDNNDCGCLDLKEVIGMFFGNRQLMMTALVALFLGVLSGYILGWYFGPSGGKVPQTASTLTQVASPAPKLSDKLSDLSISDSGNVLISTPRPQDTISTPLKVNGLVRVFENRVHVRLKNKDGVEVRKTSFTAQGADIGYYLALSVDLKFAQPTVPGDGTLEVFGIAAKDGSEVDKVVIPIKFAAHGGSGL